MNVIDHGPLGELLSTQEEAVLKAWMVHQSAQGNLRAGAAETHRQSAAFLAALRQALQRGASTDLDHPAWQDVKRLLTEL